MLVNQIAVFLENREGRIHEFAKVLGEAGVNIMTMSVADTADYGILRCITSDNEKAAKALKEHGFNAISTDLIGFEISHIPGELEKVLKVLETNKVNIGYMYSFGSIADNKAVIIMKVDDNEKTLKLLSENGIILTTGSII